MYPNVNFLCPGARRGDGMVNSKVIYLQATFVVIAKHFFVILHVKYTRSLRSI